VHPFIEAEKVAGSSAERACRLLEVSRSAFYARRRSPSKRHVADAALTAEIRQIHATSKGTYGSPRVHAELRDNGAEVGRRRVSRLMRESGIVGLHKRRWRKTAVVDPAAERARDLIGRDFAPGPMTDRRYVGDITYLATWEGFCYLATVIDLASRRVVGWSIASHMRTELVEDALRMAFVQRRPARGLIMHTDRGSQYTSGDFARLARDNGVVLSVGMKGECWDNAVAESFFATIKRELIETRPWPTRVGLERAVFDYIEGWYNTRRRHSSLGYKSPAVFEAISHNVDRQAA
jgi:transposase InsO family protein